MARRWRGLVATGLPLGLCACEVGPDYMRPTTPTEMQFKENEGWTPATPRQAAGWESWWGIYDDPILDALEKQVDINNQNLQVAEAAYRVARAQVGIERALLLPNIGANLGVRGAGGGARGTTGTAGTGTGTGGTGTGGTGTGGTGTGTGTGTSGSGTTGTTGGGGGSSGGTTFTYSAGLSATWDIDVWGGIRRAVEADVATAQASAADIAAARLSAQAQLAVSYFQLRAADEDAQLLTAAIDDFRMALTIAQNRYAVGVATLADVSTADTSVDSAETQLVGIRLTRDTAEHAIAALTGKTPSEVDIAVGMTPMDVPVVPAGIPSTLLERRPDVAAAERNVVSANAGIGVAVAAWYPDITLDASYGFSATSLGKLFNASSASWSFGPSLAQNIFDGGQRISQNRQARARYDQAVATYRQTVLTAFQQVEDELGTLKILEEEAAAANKTVMDARETEMLDTNQYRAGTVDFTTVVTAQTARLNAEVTALNILNQRLAASVNLVMALGGGWDQTRIPEPGPFYTLPETTQNDGPEQDAKAADEAKKAGGGSFFGRIFRTLSTP